MPHFERPKIYSCGKHCEKRRNCLEQAISPFLTMFSTQYGTHFSFQMHLKTSSVICFKCLKCCQMSKMLSSGNGLSKELAEVGIEPASPVLRSCILPTKLPGLDFPKENSSHMLFVEMVNSLII